MVDEFRDLCTDVSLFDGTVQLTHYQEKTFGEQEQYEFTIALADELDVPVSDISIKKVTNVETPYNRRRLGGANLVLYDIKGVDVNFEARTVSTCLLLAYLFVQG